jgi:hypothetical protein
LAGSGSSGGAHSNGEWARIGAKNTDLQVRPEFQTVVRKSLPKKVCGHDLGSGASFDCSVNLLRWRQRGHLSQALIANVKDVLPSLPRAIWGA